MMRVQQSLLVVLFLSILAAATTPAIADEFLGGTGGTRFPSVDCPPGKVVIGLAGRAGAVIDTMQLLCGQANGNDNDPPLPTRIGPSNGGAQVSAVCPPLHAAVSIQVNKKDWRRHDAVSQITLTCGLTIDGSDPIHVVFGPDIGGGSKNAGTAGCGAHNFIGGFSGRSGTWIDAVGPDCRNVSVLRGH